MTNSKQYLMNNAPIIIAGSGRSGTTWVLDAIAQANDLRTIFEPLHPIGLPSAKPFANRYVRDDANEPELKCFMDKVFSGVFKSLWANYRVRPDRLHFTYCQSGSLKHKLGSLKYNYKKLAIHYSRYHKIKSSNLIVKFIRANLMLGWLSRNYVAKTFLIVRHPCGVVDSKMRLGGRDWQHEALLQQYCQDNQLVEDYLHKYKDVLTRPLSPIAGHTAIWCIENALPIHNARSQDHCVVFYEDLIINSDVEWKRIIESLDLRDVPDKDILIEPSQQTSKETKNKLLDNTQVSRWMKSFNEEQLAEIDKILKIFEVSIYNTFDPMPLGSAKS